MRVAEDESLDAGRVQHREQLSHQSAFGEALDRRVLERRGIHHREDFVAPLLQCRRNPESVREPDASLVEVRDADMLAVVLERTTIELLLPDQLDVRDHGRDDQHIRAAAPLLPCEPVPVADGVLDIGHFH